MNSELPYTNLIIGKIIEVLKAVNLIYPEKYNSEFMAGFQIAKEEALKAIKEIKF